MCIMTSTSKLCNISGRLSMDDWWNNTDWGKHYLEETRPSPTLSTTDPTSTGLAWVNSVMRGRQQPTA